jgi:hypothetical protein
MKHRLNPDEFAEGRKESEVVRFVSLVGFCLIYFSPIRVSSVFHAWLSLRQPPRLRG